MINFKRMQIQPLDISNAVAPIVLFANKQNERVAEISSQLSAASSPRVKSHGHAAIPREKLMWKQFKYVKSMMEQIVLEYAAEETMTELFDIVREVAGQSSEGKIFLRAAELIAETAAKIRESWATMHERTTRDPRALEFEQLMAGDKNRRHTDRILLGISELAREMASLGENLIEQSLSLQALCSAIVTLAYWIQTHSNATREEMTRHFLEVYESDVFRLHMERRLESEDRRIPYDEFAQKMGL